MNSQAKYLGLGHNNSSTTAFFFQGSEDLGGGLKASFMAELDWAPTLSTSANQNSSTAALSQVYTGTPFNGEQFLAVSGGFGTLKMGSPNSPVLSIVGDSNPFGTALGGGFSSGFGRFGTGTASGFNQYVGAAGSTGRIIRHNKSVVFETPSFSGLTALVEYVAGNSKGGWTSNDNDVLGTSLRYAQGPLKANYSTTKASAGAIASSGDASFARLAGNTTAGGATTAAYLTANVLPANTSVTWNVISGNYTMGNTTIMAGITSTKTDGITTAKVLEDSKSQNIGVKYVMGNVDLLGNYLRRTSNLTEAQQVSDAITSGTYARSAKMIGLGANYNLSKQSHVYFRYEQIKGLNAASTTQTALTNGVAGVGNFGGATQVTTSVGLRKLF